MAGGGLGGGTAGGCGESASDGDDGLDGEEGTWCGWKTPELGRVDGEGLWGKERKKNGSSFASKPIWSNLIDK